MSGFEPSANAGDPTAEHGVVEPADASSSATEEAADGAAHGSALSLGELERLGELDVDDHPDVYQRIHADLQSALASIDDA